MAGKIAAVAALLAAALFLPALGAAPFVDPPEGFHAAIAREMVRSGDWVTPRVAGVRYFDKPPLLYWVMGAAMAVRGPGEWAARLGSALPGVALAGLTAWMGARLAGPRVGLLAGLMVVANLEVFLYARLVKPDLLFVLCITAGLAGFIEAMGSTGEGARRRARIALGVGYAALGVAALAKDVLGTLGPLAVLALFVRLGGRRPPGGFAPGWGLLILAAVAVPWYLLVERQSPGFLWYTVVDNHVLNVARQRVFPDEDVPLGALEFLAVTAVGFFPWSLAAPLAAFRGLRDTDPAAGPWRILALWATAVLVVFTLSPFKLPHYGLPAFPALALLTAKLWDDALARRAGAPRGGALLAPPLVGLAAVAAVCLVAVLGLLPVSGDVLGSADVATRNLAAQGGDAPFMTLGQLRPILWRLVGIFGVGAAAVAVGLTLRWPAAALGALAAAMLAFLPVSVEGFTLFAQSRTVRPLAAIVTERLLSGDVVVHEGALENSGAWLLGLDRPVRVVGGRRSNLAFGGTFPEGRDVFWEDGALRAAWAGEHRVFLLSAVEPGRSVTRGLPEGSVHVLGRAGGRTLYSNRP